MCFRGLFYNRNWLGGPRVDIKYVKGNIQVISYKANRIKNTIVADDLRVYLDYIAGSATIEV